MIDGAVALVASIALLPGVIGVIAAPEYAPPAASHSIIAGPVLNDALDFAGAAAPARNHVTQVLVHSSLLPQLTGKALLDQLPLLEPAQLAEFGEQHPQTIRQLLLSPPAAAYTEAWWAALPLHLQHELHATAPQVIGSLPGIPLDIRDSANRLLLDSTISALTAELERDEGSANESSVRSTLAMLREVESAVATEAGEPKRHLRMLDTTLTGRASIVIGDLATADYVSYLVPGMLFTLEGQIVDWTQTASELYNEQTRWLHRLGQDDPSLRGKTVATVAWMGYHTPDLATVGSPELADEGARYLSSTIDALYSERATNRPVVSVLAHSYGSTAAMKALTTGDFSIDALVAVGSPGSPARTVDDLHVRGRNVFVGQAAWDPVVGSSYFGTNPGDSAYGARIMGVDGGVDPITHAELTASVGHNEYFAPGSESLRNMALIGIGRGSLVGDAAALDPQSTMARFNDLA